VIYETAHYRDGHRVARDDFTLEQAAQIARAGDDGFVWIALLQPDAEELERMQGLFDLNELAMEDVQSVHERPKIDVYPESGVLLGVLRAARYDDAHETVRLNELSVFLGRGFVITIRTEGSPEAIRARAERRPDLLRHGPSAVLWAALDVTVDDYAPVVAGLEQDVDEIEATVFGGETASPERIYRLRGQANDFARAVHPLLAPVDSLRRGIYEQIAPELVPFFRDVADHLHLVDEEVQAQRDALGAILQANIAVISLQQTEVGVRQNDAVKVLTVISTIFLPLSFITGFFGMNFGWLVDEVRPLWVFLAFGVGSLVVSTALLWAWFARTGLIGPGE
jgi:magnesium transporter